MDKHTWREGSSPFGNPGEPMHVSSEIRCKRDVEMHVKRPANASKDTY
jgi:hypothetical protein